MKNNRIFETGGVPVNRNASNAIKGGAQYSYECDKYSGNHWKTPPATMSVPDGIEDLTGNTVGRFKVIGLFAIRPKKKNGLRTLDERTRWLVRCSCGDYEDRKGKAIKNPDNGEDSCHNCRRLFQMQRHTEFLRTGKNTIYRSGPK